MLLVFWFKNLSRSWLLVRLQMDQEPVEELAPEPVGPRPCGRAQAKRSGKAMRGPSGLASRLASFVLGVLGYRIRFRRGGRKLTGPERLFFGEVGSLQWVSARLLSRAAPISSSVPLPNFA